MAPTLEGEPSNYMQTLTRYLSNIMNSTLLGLPREIKELIYFDAFGHAANMILVCYHTNSHFTSNMNPGSPTLARSQEDQSKWSCRPSERCSIPI